MESDNKGQIHQDAGACLSVIIPVYNEAETLAEVVEKVLAVPHLLEVIIVDDCSTDGTPAVISKLAEQHSVIRTARLEKNSGKTAALKLGLR